MKIHIDLGSAYDYDEGLERRLKEALDRMPPSGVWELVDTVARMAEIAHQEIFEIEVSGKIIWSVRDRFRYMWE